MNNITSSARLIKSFQDFLFQFLKLFVALYLFLVDLLETNKLFRTLIITLLLSIFFMYMIRGALNIFDYEQVQALKALHNGDMDHD